MIQLEIATILVNCTNTITKKKQLCKKSTDTEQTYDHNNNNNKMPKTNSNICVYYLIFLSNLHILRILLCILYVLFIHYTNNNLQTWLLFYIYQIYVCVLSRIVKYAFVSYVIVGMLPQFYVFSL